MALLLSLANTQIETVPHSDSFIPLHEALLCPFNSRQLLGLAKCHTWWIQASKALEERRIIHRPREKTARLKIGYISSAFGNTETTYLMQSGKYFPNQLFLCILNLIMLWCFKCSSYMIRRTLKLLAIV
jgi:hypothetical protein